MSPQFITDGYWESGGGRAEEYTAQEVYSPKLEANLDKHRFGFYCRSHDSNMNLLLMDHVCDFSPDFLVWNCIYLTDCYK